MIFVIRILGCFFTFYRKICPCWRCYLRRKYLSRDAPKLAFA